MYSFGEDKTGIKWTSTTETLLLAPPAIMECQLLQGGSSPAHTVLTFCSECWIQNLHVILHHHYLPEGVGENSCQI